MKTRHFIPLLFGVFLSTHTSCQTVDTPVQQTLIPLQNRVNIQADTARTQDIIDGVWVGVGSNKPYTIQKDYTLMKDGRPSYRFELKSGDNTLEGYSKGETKGRAELSYCYAVSRDFAGFPADYYRKSQIMKTVYFAGKGSCSQGSTMRYRFSVYVPKNFSNQAQTIFAQWHGMPDRTLVKTPQGEVRKLTPDEFMELEKHTIFKKDRGMEKIMHIKANGDTVYKAGKPNGWMIEQGGFPPLAFGFSQGYFYIKSNSDRKWLTDKSDRCNANPAKHGIMEPVRSKYKESTILYKENFEEFPKEQWVTFDITVKWTRYGGEKETIDESGMVDITMSYDRKNKPVSRHIVNHEKVEIGRNDEQGYYFKFGIYRVGGSTEPVCYNLTDYSEEEVK